MPETPAPPKDCFLTPLEHRDAAQFSPTDLSSEINLLRAVLHVTDMNGTF